MSDSPKQNVSHTTDSFPEITRRYGKSSVLINACFLKTKQNKSEKMGQHKKLTPIHLASFLIIYNTGKKKDDGKESFM